MQIGGLRRKFLTLETNLLFKEPAKLQGELKHSVFYNYQFLPRWHSTLALAGIVIRKSRYAVY